MKATLLFLSLLIIPALSLGQGEIFLIRYNDPNNLITQLQVNMGSDVTSEAYCSPATIGYEAGPYVATKSPCIIDELFVRYNDAILPAPLPQNCENLKSDFVIKIETRFSNNFKNLTIKTVCY
ncbi:MAG: hypothetical protein A3E87_07450 [Gammaproteobacteria bacterium RIFCSPHIGHO2_12_FULL_35_23]|nr:MAG: hypothetical protein A3E87_07450 [Gammaproteobacteria bacterium RIFCSPHIGHO2_12_FULL_35_23]